MEKIELNIIALTNSESNEGNFVVILEEESGVRRLPIVIGPFEAQAIALALEGMETNRPMTHDLFKNTLSAGGVELTEVVISDLLEGIFHARLYGIGTGGQSFNVDARSSDAIAMAIRFNCPIFTTRTVLDEAGIIFQQTVSPQEKKEKKDLNEYSTEELQEMLGEVIEKENYEQASMIRDILKGRNAI